MSKAASKGAGGRKSREVRLRELERHIAEVRDGRYLAKLEREYRQLDLQEALSKARGILGSAGVSMVETMLKKAEVKEAGMERLRELLIEAKLPARLVARITTAGAPGAVQAGPKASKPGRAPGAQQERPDGPKTPLDPGSSEPIAAEPAPALEPDAEQPEAIPAKVSATLDEPKLELPWDQP